MEFVGPDLKLRAKDQLSREYFPGQNLSFGNRKTEVCLLCEEDTYVGED